jgi:outer membrane protein
MTAVFKGYDKVKVSGEEFKAAVMAKKKDLMSIMQEMQQESEILAKVKPGASDFKKHEDRITQLKAQNEAGREQAEREFALREAEMLATLYKEIQDMVARVAKWRGMTYVLRVSNDPVTGSDPNSAMRAIERSVVFAEPTNDITNQVVQYLNAQYKKAGGPSPKATSSVTPAAVKPTGN